jgi:CubicO group peptidase (beta-lactamase class C family)
MPGAVIAVARKGKLVYYESFGFLDKSKSTPMPKDAIFSIASMTKPVVAAGGADVLRGEPSARARARRHLPAAAEEHERRGAAARRQRTETFDRVPARRQPTIQDLMRHTAGSPTATRARRRCTRPIPGGSGNVAETMSGAEFIDALAKLPLHYQPARAGTTATVSTSSDWRSRASRSSRSGACCRTASSVPSA